MEADGPLSKLSVIEGSSLLEGRRSSLEGGGSSLLEGRRSSLKGGGSSLLEGSRSSLEGEAHCCWKDAGHH